MRYRLHVVHCVKFKRKGKLNSHLWFFKGFCENFNPEYCVLLDAGTEMCRYALRKVFTALESDQDLAAVTGYIETQP
jgi:chitin synthase